MRRLTALFSVLAIAAGTLFLSGPVAHAAWSDWTGHGGQVYGTPAVTTWGPGRLDVFAVGTDYALRHRVYENGRWHDWESLGGYLTTSPSAVAWGPGRIDVVAGDAAGGVQRLVYDGVWRPWETLDTGTYRYGAAISSRGPGRLDLFTVGRGGAGDTGLHVKSFADGTWSGWTALGGDLASTPAAVSWDANRVDVFAKGADSSLHHTWADNGVWGSWESLGGGIDQAPGVASWAPGRLDVFARGTDNSLYHKAFDTVWHAWEWHGGVLSSGAAAVSWGPNRIDAFVTGNDSAVHQKAWS
ncbi:carbohydrate-binding protein [Lentzea sp. NPDC042327]|uniref:carbohydrate-binding protein n=1 Tax=Lentzea sp. NPDC042327 TaxID=3154801 RepID=UPI0033DFA37A